MSHELLRRLHSVTVGWHVLERPISSLTDDVAQPFCILEDLFSRWSLVRVLAYFVSCGFNDSLIFRATAGLFCSASLIWGAEAPTGTVWDHRKHFPRQGCPLSQGLPAGRHSPGSLTCGLTSLCLWAGNGISDPQDQGVTWQGQMLWQAPLAGAQLSLRPIREGEHTPWPVTARGASTDPPCRRHEARPSFTREGRGPSELPMLLVQGPENARSRWFLCWLGECNMPYYYLVPPVQRSQTSLPVSYQLSEFSFLASCIISKVYSCSQWGRGRRSRSMPLYRLGVSSF